MAVANVVPLILYEFRADEIERGIVSGTPEATIPENVREFLLRQIDSVAELEALLLLRKTAGEHWTAVSVAGRLYVSESVSEAVLAHLAESGLCSRHDGSYGYEPITEELRKTVEDVADAYARCLIPVTNLIHAKPSRIQQFADAFRFRKDN